MFRPITIALTIALFISSGCSTTPNIALNLRGPASTETILISQRTSFIRHQGIFNVRWEYGLMPGEYISVQENDFGTFYRGVGRPIWARGGSETASAQLFLGGVWVPKAEDEAPRLYIIRDTELHSTQNLDSYAQSYSQSLILSGQPIGSSVAGSVIGAAIVGAMLKAEEGTIYIHDASNNSDFDNQLILAVKSRTQTK